MQPDFSELYISLQGRGYIHNSCVLNVVLYTRDRWPITTEVLTRLHQNDIVMIHWICCKRLSDRKPTKPLCFCLLLNMVTNVLECSRLTWYDHLMRMKDHI